MVCFSTGLKLTRPFYTTSETGFTQSECLHASRMVKSLGIIVNVSPPQKGFLFSHLNSKIKQRGTSSSSTQESTWVKELHVPFFFFSVTISSSAPCSDLQLSRTGADGNQHKKKTLPLQGIRSAAASLRSVCGSGQAGRAGSKRCLLPWISCATVLNAGSDTRAPSLLRVKTGV